VKSLDYMASKILHVSILTTVVPILKGLQWFA
jgi:hypothetical protein